MTNDIVAGKAAWTRLKNGSKSWQDWVIASPAHNASAARMRASRRSMQAMDKLSSENS